jgi:hypothetical protein
MLRSHQVQVSRSLGHKQLVQYGITWEPDTLVRTLDPEQAFAVVVLSDGVTDSLRRAVSLPRRLGLKRELSTHQCLNVNSGLMRVYLDHP